MLSFILKGPMDQILTESRMASTHLPALDLGL